MIEDTSDSRPEFQREIVQFQYQKYIAFFFFIYVGSYLAPVIALMFYLFLILKPLFLEVESFIVILTSLDSLIIFLTIPLVVVAFYLSHLFFNPSISASMSLRTLAMAVCSTLDDGIVTSCSSTV